jgi:hypothetical protein
MKPSIGHKYVSLLFVLTLIASCAPATKISVKSVSDSGSEAAGSFIYALPMTAIDIQVMAEEVTTIPGPYYKYAAKYLGIENVPEKTESTWQIREMNLSSHIEADPDYIYAVNGISIPDDHAGIMRLLNTGLILPADRFSFNHANQYGYPVASESILYTDLGIKRNFEAEKNVDISLVMPETDNTSKTAGRTGLKEKTVEQKAEEAANFIIKLKKRRFKLVAGQYDSMPQGEAMADALEELARLEENYLSLFIGKKVTRQYRRSYSLTPTAGLESDRLVLFRFSEQEGFVDVRAANGVPVVLDLKDANLTKVLEQYRLPVKQPLNLLYYRVADQVSVKLLAGEQLWAEAQLPVFQTGAIVPMNLEGKK